MMAHTTSLAVAACLLLTPALTRAQEAVDPRLTVALHALREQPVVRIQTEGVHVGRYRSTTSDSLTLRASDGQRRIALRDVREIAEQTHRAGTGALIGAVVLGSVGALVGTIAGGGFCDAMDCSDAYRGGGVGGAAIGAVAGAVIGGGVGYLVRGWHVLYQR